MANFWFIGDISRLINFGRSFRQPKVCVAIFMDLFTIAWFIQLLRSEVQKAVQLLQSKPKIKELKPVVSSIASSVARSLTQPGIGLNTDDIR